MMRWTRTVTPCIMIMTGTTTRSGVFTMTCHPLPKGTEGADLPKGTEGADSQDSLVGTEGAERLHLPMSLIAEHAGLSLERQHCSFRYDNFDKIPLPWSRTKLGMLMSWYLSINLQD